MLVHQFSLAGITRIGLDSRHISDSELTLRNFVKLDYNLFLSLYTHCYYDELSV